MLPGSFPREECNNVVISLHITIRPTFLYHLFDYSEDSTVDLDMNIVMTHSCRFLEIQGTAEKASFDKKQVLEIMDAAQDALKSTFELQALAAEGQPVDG